jgi:bifunctional non-homologous end joining protein LigD
VARGAKAGQRASARLSEYRRKRDFESTPEPAGGGTSPTGDHPAFVIQKHRASRLHFDLRLEVDGATRSWAVPKGPSLDPSVRRLAIQVEDHPLEYNTFEGVIPAGEYGGGTVMIWDRGHYTADEPEAGEDDQDAARRGLEAGKFGFTLHGERLRGSFALIRTRRGGEDSVEWLLIKHDDDDADPSVDPVERWTTSAASGRTMDAIAAGEAHGEPAEQPEPASKPGAKAGSKPARKRARTAAPQGGGGRAPTGFSPMLATAATAPPQGDGWCFEPKWDGIRIVAYAAADGAALLTRNGNDKRAQFPEVAGELTRLAASRGSPFVVDGELVGMRDGEVVRFESLQARMHLADRNEAARLAREEPATLVVFDLLLDGDQPLLDEPWQRRRDALEALFEELDARDAVRLGDASADLERMTRRARAGGWEGLIAKRADAPYVPGRRTRHWLKLKMENRQEFVVGGWTEPRGSRPHLGALLLGYHDDRGRLVYAGHTGTGMSHDDLRDLHRRLSRIERKTSPFAEAPDTNEKPHWTTPRVVVEVRFNEWTSTGVLRQPVFLGVREDRDPREIVREPGAMDPLQASRERSKTPGRSAKSKSRKAAAAPSKEDGLVAELRKLEAGKGEGTVRVDSRRKLDVTSLGKVFFPRPKITKGDLMRYYAAMAPLILPLMRDRPLVLKRYPEGVRGESFYQQSAPERVPDAVRVEVLESDDGEEQRRFVGGDLATLLYTVQLGAISYDPWHSRIGRMEYADYTILDLDPGSGAGFRTVVRVARLVHEELERSGLRGALKTSGSTGLHVYLPLASGTPLESARLVAEIVANRVAARDPRIATVERSVRKRPRGTVYVDYLQNILGKTVAGTYAVRARPEATVSTPLAWDELTDDLDPREFTVRSVPERVATVGDLWSEALRRKNSLRRFLDAAGTRSRTG